MARIHYITHFRTKTEREGTGVPKIDISNRKSPLFGILVNYWHLNLIISEYWKDLSMLSLITKLPTYFIHEKGIVPILKKIKNMSNCEGLTVTTLFHSISRLAKKAARWFQFPDFLLVSCFASLHLIGRSKSLWNTACNLQAAVR